MNDPEPNHFVDVTDVYDRKRAAIAAHQSQFPGAGCVDSMIRSRLEQTAKEAGPLPGWNAK
jgi:LmbE family N-acetylglucosaminyl deacetylase